MVIKLNWEHNHDTDLDAKKIDKLKKEAVANAIANPTVAPSVALQGLPKNFFEDPSLREVGPQGLKIEASIARQIQRGRKKNQNCPNIPRTWEEMIIPDALRQDLKGNNWVLCEHEIDEGKKILGFCSDSGKYALKNSDRWVINYLYMNVFFNF